jgi:succinyl-CoA:(S)-malate CoA-transferase subunit B
MGRPEIAGDGIYGTIKVRDTSRDKVDGIVADWTSVHTQAEIITLCDEAQVPCSIVAAIDEIFEDPQYQARKNIARVKSPRVGELAVPNVVPHLSATPGRIESLGPALGEHNLEVYGGLLGLDSAEIERLEQAEVI